METLMTLVEVAAYLRLSKDTVYRMAHAGRIPASKVGNQWRFRKDEVDAWLEKNRNIVSDLLSKSRLREIVLEYQASLEEVLGDDLEFVLLYGSQARGDAAAGSDIDVLCVMRSPFDYGDLIDRTSEATAELSLKYEVVLSRAFVGSDDFKSRNTPFLMNVRREGVVP